MKAGNSLFSCAFSPPVFNYKLGNWRSGKNFLCFL